MSRAQPPPCPLGPQQLPQGAGGWTRRPSAQGDAASGAGDDGAEWPVCTQRELPARSSWKDTPLGSVDEPPWAGRQQRGAVCPRWAGHSGRGLLARSPDTETWTRGEEWCVARWPLQALYPPYPSPTHALVKERLDGTLATQADQGGWEWRPLPAQGPQASVALGAHPVPGGGVRERPRVSSAQSLSQALPGALQELWGTVWTLPTPGPGPRGRAGQLLGDSVQGTGRKRLGLWSLLGDECCGFCDGRRGRFLCTVLQVAQVAEGPHLCRLRAAWGGRPLVHGQPCGGLYIPSRW